MRFVAHLAALVGLGAIAVAFGDWVSAPNLLGGLALLVGVIALGLALGQLYRPGGWGSSQPAPARPSRDLKARDGGSDPHSAPLGPAPEPEPKPEPLWSEAKPRRRAPRPTSSMADAGWDAREAEEARERRREERARRKGKR